RLHLADGLAEVGAAHVVAADDEPRRRVQVEAVEEREDGDERGGVRQAAAQRGQAEGRRRADAAEGANHPQTNATLTHGAMSCAKKVVVFEAKQSPCPVAGRRPTSA